MLKLEQTMVEGRRWFYTNDKDLKVEVCLIEHDRSKTSLMSLWVKNGYMKKFIPTTWSIRCYYTREDGTCCEAFNPQIKSEPNEYGTSPRSVINFDWELEATEENLQKLLDEIERRYDMKDDPEYLFDEYISKRWNGEGWYTIQGYTEPNKAIWLESEWMLREIVEHSLQVEPIVLMYGSGDNPNNPNVEAGGNYYY